MSRRAPASSLDMRTASLAHELRQPLFALKARLQLVGEHGISAKEVGPLLASVAHMEQLVDHYGGPADAQGGAPARFDLRDVVAEAVTLVEERARQEGVELRVRLSNTAVPVPGRATAVRQVIVNLLLNAMDAVAEVQVRRVEVDVTAEEQRASVVVRDSGQGLPAELQARVFEPFVTTKETDEVSGLGLFIAQQLLREVHGALTLAEGEAGGTCARVDLPVVP